MIAVTSQASRRRSTGGPGGAASRERVNDLVGPAALPLAAAVGAVALRLLALVLVPALVALILLSLTFWRQGCQMAKFGPFLSLDCARVEGVGAQSKEGKGSNFGA